MLFVKGLSEIVFIVRQPVSEWYLTQFSTVTTPLPVRSGGTVTALERGTD